MADAGLEQTEQISLKYEVKFDDGFDFKEDGKLPGIFGGAPSCKSGGAEGCFTSRLRWRQDGKGELYLYIPDNQVDGFCERPNYYCNAAYGHSINQGSFEIIPGTWHKIEQRIKLNNPGEFNGIMRIFVDGILAVSLDDLNFRTSDDTKINGMYFNVQFGGSDPESQARVFNLKFYF